MDRNILIIGATGFVGSNLTSHLVSLGEKVSLFIRDPKKLTEDHEGVHKIYEGDLSNSEDLIKPIEENHIIYYLSHSMGDDPNFRVRESQHARNVNNLLTTDHRMIYLGGILPKGKSSQHLGSRKMVGEIFHQGPAISIELRASIILGVGSASFEIIRSLINRLPFVPTTSWMESLCQPIAIEDILYYLTEATRLDLEGNSHIFDIGGATQLTYRELVIKVAKEMGKVRLELPLPAISKSLATKFFRIVIPEYADLARDLMTSIDIPTVVDETKAFPSNHAPFNLKLALEDIDMESEDDFSSWLSALKKNPEIPQYLQKQNLYYRFARTDLPIDQVMGRISKVAPQTVYQGSEGIHQVKLPFAGELGLIEDDKELILSYKPLFFFQALGWTLLFKAVATTERYLSK